MTYYLNEYQLHAWRDAITAVEETLRSTDDASSCKQPMRDLHRTVATRPEMVITELGQLARV